MTKNNKKLTYKQLEGYIAAVDNKYDHATNTVGRTITDFIEFLGKREDFIDYLKEKYKDRKETEENSSSKT